jgi:hypothetical protein
MATKPQFIILTGEEVELFTFCSQLNELKYSWMALDKTIKPFARLKEKNYFVLFHIGANEREDSLLLSEIKTGFPHLSIIAVASETQAIPAGVAQLTHAILKLPAKNDSIQTKLLKYINPNLKQNFRLHERKNTELEISWTTDPKKNQISHTANISAGGIFVKEAQSIPKPGEVIEFVLKVPGKQVISGRGIVRWVAPSEGQKGFGLEFIEVNLSEKKVLESLITTQG